MRARLLSARQWRAHPLPSLDTKEKGERGNVLIVAGSPENPGAAYLAGVAALRVGAGRLTIAATPQTLVHLAPLVPEAMLISLRASSCLTSCLKSADALVIGPGWQANATARGWCAQLLGQVRASTVIDAGALHGFAPPTWPSRCVLTPHAGEMAHLSGHSKAVIEERPVEIARDYASENGVVLLLKGPTSVLADPEGSVWLHRGGHPGLGTSGSGDVLAGCIGGLLARGMEPLWAAAWGAHLHGRAGRLLAQRVGPTGYLAREIADALPSVLRLSPSARSR